MAMIAVLVFVTLSLIIIVALDCLFFPLSQAVALQVEAVLQVEVAAAVLQVRLATDTPPLVGNILWLVFEIVLDCFEHLGPRGKINTYFCDCHMLDIWFKTIFFRT